MKYFVATYTNACKDYCDNEFFTHVAMCQRFQDFEFHVIDNTSQKELYMPRLERLMNGIAHASLEWIKVDLMPQRTRFLRNLAESVACLRNEFLSSDAEYMITLESDVIPPFNFAGLFNEVAGQADIIGGLYYRGFHADELWTKTELVPARYVLSGCTLYSRKVLEKIPFRWSEENFGAFPDAWMSLDAGAAGFRLANYCKIRCDHLHAPNGGRGQENIR